MPPDEAASTKIREELRAIIRLARILLRQVNEIEAHAGKEPR